MNFEGLTISLTKDYPISSRDLIKTSIVENKLLF